MGDITYDCIGENYNRNRVADRRILQTIIDLLDLPASKLIVDIGAGTGNYANALTEPGYRLLAVEPSEIMRKQAVFNDNIMWINGIAESLPLGNASMDAAIIILAIHHFSDLGDAADEVARVCPFGPVILLTMDPRQGDKFWFYDYFPEIARHVLHEFPPLNEIIDLFSCTGHWQCQIVRFPLPHDFEDKNMCAGWNRPEMYLDPLMRQNTSGFALASPSVVQKGINMLENDLKSGRWDTLNGHLRRQQSFDAGFRFLVFRA
ncbi:MAG: methyltransferase domain-containing protein [Dehalococcoidia bacterium]|nr:methyltransferase domain-containing protein [Dehalococcoidia bacterium]MDD5647472.1 methyltransferase domain-containing protein [Dehalococcoidia bacterium]